MPWSQFTKGALPGSSRAVFGRPARDPMGPRPGAVHFFIPRGPRVTFNFNLKVTADQTRKLPDRGSVGPLPGSARDTGINFERKHAGYPPEPPTVPRTEPVWS